jgi:hypothetical protein
LKQNNQVDLLQLLMQNVLVVLLHVLMQSNQVVLLQPATGRRNAIASGVPQWLQW